MEMVLSTVIEITKMLLAANPDVYIYFTGSTAAITRLYQIIVGNISEIVCGQYDVWGELEGHWVPFEKNVNYEAFLVSKSL
jgi:methionine salvage enolase-phosphatase E1